MFNVYKQLPNSAEMVLADTAETLEEALDLADGITRAEGVATQVEESVGGASRVVGSFGSLVVAEQVAVVPPAAATPAGAMPYADFLRLFTLEERVAIRTAAQTDMVIADYMGLAQAQGYVRMGSVDAQHGIWYLVQQGLLTELRAQEILGQL